MKKGNKEVFFQMQQKNFIIWVEICNALDLLLGKLMRN